MSFFTRNFVFLSIIFFCRIFPQDGSIHVRLDKKSIHCLIMDTCNFNLQSEILIHENSQEWKDLNGDALVAKFDKTRSFAGRLIFKKLIQPITSLDKLAARKKVFQSFTDDQVAYQIAQKAIACYAALEDSMLALIDEGSGLHKAFASLPPLVYDIETPKYSPLSAAYMARMLQYMPWAGLILGVCTNANMVHTVFKKYATSRSYWDLYTLISVAYWGATLPFKQRSEDHLQKKVIASMRDLYKALIDLAAMVKESKNLLQEVSEDSPVQDFFAQWKSLQDSSSSAYNQELCTLLDLLDEPMFKGSVSIGIEVSMRKIFKTYALVRRCRELLVTLMRGYALLDAHTAVATLYHEQDRTHEPLAWVEFMQNDSPMADLIDLYNPLTPEFKVCNTFKLGKAFDTSHVLLTGPHGCGKTTMMKSVAYAYILGQSLLLVPARQAFMTSLTKMGSYFNIVDDITKGISSFMAERKRIDALKDMVRSFSPTDRCIIFFDEPYAKTLQEVGERCVYELISELSRVPGLMIIGASHFEKPAQLQRQTNGLVVNYQPELLEPSKGLFIRTFKIMPGKATWWFDDTKKRSRFIDWLAFQTPQLKM